MMTPVPMRRMEIALLTDDLAQAGLVLARTGVFAPAPDRDAGDRLPERPLPEYRTLWERALTRYRKVADFLGFEPERRTPPDSAPTHDALEEIDRWLKGLWHHCSACEENRRKAHESLREVRQLQQLLRDYRQLDLDLGLLQRDSRFLAVRLGSIPRASLGRFRDAAALAGFVVTAFARRQDRAQVVVAGLKERSARLETLLKAADFHEFSLPPEFSDHPARVEQELAARERRLRRQLTHLERETRRQLEQHRPRLQQAWAQLRAASAVAQLGSAAAGRGGLTRITGWVPADEASRVEAALQRALPRPVVVQTSEPDPRRSAEVPSCLRHPPWLRPFAALVRNYGIPRYREVDPTWFLTVGFAVMFGMMFGDIGHGALFILAGGLLGRRLPQARPLFVLAGAAAMVFGLLYGSVFGYEHLIPPLWMSPLEDPVRMLQVAFGWGVLFIVFATVLRIRNDLVEGRFGDALFESHGLSGLILYLALLGVGWRLASGDTPGLALWTALALPTAAILVWKWARHTAPPGERLLVVLIEGFETFMNYISNTLSFLRVAAFGLNHVALALAVFALAGMMETTGHWLTVVLGNLFIMVLEGAIVAIQVLRLEYYEGFSRFFRGDGRPFRPLTLSLTGAGEG